MLKKNLKIISGSCGGATNKWSSAWWSPDLPLQFSTKNFDRIQNFSFGLGDDVYKGDIFEKFQSSEFNILKEVVVYFDQFAIGICQCHCKSEEVRLKSEVLSTTINPRARFKWDETRQDLRAIPELGRSGQDYFFLVLLLGKILEKSGK